MAKKVKKEKLEKTKVEIDSWIAYVCGDTNVKVSQPNKETK